ncbi:MULTISPECIES: hypothetical protein [Enterococcus]|uniref:hypothetical protein n=1 Tax=Enterococcus TaxID=1350 RepID=UPI00065DE755|nr:MULTISPECIES: hypothetical protein [Enterococcus]KAF1301146.1 hypothetical protein BAU16_10430 [Enterococcus sp. JM9B]
MDLFTLLLIIFVFVLFFFLLIIQKELVFRAKKRKGSWIIIPLATIFVLWGTFGQPATLDESIRGILSGLIVLSFLLDGRGLTEERILVNPMDKRGIPFAEIDRIVLYQQENIVKMNFFRRGMRGPLLKFSAPIQEIVLFLSDHLKEGTPIDILIDHEEEK